MFSSKEKILNILIS